MPEGLTGSTSLIINVGEQRDFTGYTITVTPGDPLAPVIVQGNNQTGKPGVTLPLALSARIVDPSGDVLAGTAVTWKLVTAGSMTLVNTISTAEHQWPRFHSRDPRPDPWQLQGSPQGRIEGDALQRDGSRPSLRRLPRSRAKTRLSTPINTAFPQPLVVKVSDAQGNGVAGATVNWTTTGSATLSATTTVTGADGRAQVTVTAG
ncbi:MAG: Ig-like domain-containing protein [Paludibaculum sp.]